MALLDQVRSDATAAMKAGERDRLGALRMAIAELEKAAKDGEADEVAVLQRERKRRQESAEAFRDAERTDLADEEEAALAVIDGYLPEQLSDEELRALVGDAVAQTGATSPRDMGRVMGAVLPKVQGRADGRRVSGIASELLKP